MDLVGAQLQGCDLEVPLKHARRNVRVPSWYAFQQVKLVGGEMCSKDSWHRKHRLRSIKKVRGWERGKGEGNRQVKVMAWRSCRVASIEGMQLAVRSAGRIPICLPSPAACDLICFSQGGSVAGCNFADANLMHANLKATNVKGADFRECKYDEMVFAKRGWLVGAIVGKVCLGLISLSLGPSCCALPGRLERGRSAGGQSCWVRPAEVHSDTPPNRRVSWVEPWACSPSFAALVSARVPIFCRPNSK